MATYKQLLAEKEKLEAQLEQVRQTELSAVIAQIHGLMDEYGLTVDDLARKRRGRPRKEGGGRASTGTPKYQDPKTGKTWSGRGRAPAWLGKNRDKFLIAQ
ncbi:H-NS family nucleoid-associated regulatory protein [Cupriavidus respiraculi]|uniref:DNA-binding protein Bv3F n=1 Tax=Cupriavidus respiraculi TaxID=195930 RepID=A0ABN7Z5X1_9BURK|nr:H-NS histone family protein [Cupriavidus respiraculi]MBY4948573.1 H-NS histone family protein [Cupriavidus respiraculi]CAG9179459.1 DNA-binding protein Bv3F [Cupriavidus respiraculi]